jgi:hypothetical protein
MKSQFLEDIYNLNKLKLYKLFNSSDSLLNFVFTIGSDISFKIRKSILIKKNIFFIKRFVQQNSFKLESVKFGWSTWYDIDTDHAA